jgi:hypothetical protein
MPLSSSYLYKRQRRLVCFNYMNTDIIVISLTHFQTACSFRSTPAVISIANDALKGVASPPLASGTSYVPFHWIVLREIIP